MEEDRIKRYCRRRYALAFGDSILLLVLLAAFQLSGAALWLGAGVNAVFVNPALVIFFYSLIFFLSYSVLTFPLEFYRSFTLEHRFGLSRQSLGRWLNERIKELIVSFVTFTILVQGFFYFLRNHPGNWWWVSSLFWILFSIVLTLIFPVLIIPLFFKYKKILDADLRRRIFDLAAKMRINLIEVLQIDYSKKSQKANAALVGLGRSKRVILTDTLLEKFSPEEIEVILAHEFAHYRLGHLAKLIFQNALATLLIFYVLFNASAAIFGWLNLEPADIASLGVWIFWFALLQAVLSPVLKWISRNMETNADRMAIKFSRLRQDFVSMMEKLSQQNLAEKNPPAWAKIIFFDHPPIQERISQAEADAAGLA